MALVVALSVQAGSQPVDLRVGSLPYAFCSHSIEIATWSVLVDLRVHAPVFVLCFTLGDVEACKSPGVGTVAMAFVLAPLIRRYC